MIGYMLELIDTEELYENDNILVLFSTFNKNGFKISTIDLAYKNKNGEIIEIKTIKELYI